MALNHETWATEYQSNRTMQSLTDQELGTAVIAAAQDLIKQREMNPITPFSPESVNPELEHWTHCMEECSLRGQSYSDYVDSNTLEAL